MNTITVIIETPAGSNQKFTFDSSHERMKINKYLPTGMVFPYDFGFVPDTLAEDGDPLDVMVISEFSTFPGCAVECRIIGGFLVRQSEKVKSNKMIRNDRILAVPVHSLMYKKIKTVGDLPQTMLDQLEKFFINYISQEDKRLKIDKRISASQAKKVIAQAAIAPATQALFEIFLPLRDNNGNPIPDRYFDNLYHMLLQEFGGVTVHHRTPVKGVWNNPSGGVDKDDMVIYEVMASHRDQVFWEALKKDLNEQFMQDEILIRSIRIQRL